MVAFTRAYPGCHSVHYMSFGSLARALGVVGYIRSRWVHSRALWRWVHPG